MKELFLFLRIPIRESSSFKLIRKGEAGHSVLLILVLLLLVTGICFDLLIIGSTNHRMLLTEQRALSAKASMIGAFQNQISLGTAVRSSIGESVSANVNMELRTCILGDLSLLCQSGIETPFVLYTSDSFDSTNKPILKVMAGPGPLVAPIGSPGRFNKFGNLCDPTVTTATSQCPYESFVTFVGMCAAGASQCAVADKIKIHFWIQVSSTLGNSSEIPVGLLKPIDLWGIELKVLDILPSEIGSITSNVTIQAIQGNAGFTPTDPGLLGIIAAAGVVDPALIPAIAQAIVSAGIKDPNIAYAIAHSQNTNSTVISTILQGFSTLGITEPILMTAYADVFNYTNSTGMPAVLTLLRQLNVTDLSLVEYFMSRDVTDPTWAAALVTPKDPTLLSTITAISYADPGMNIAIATAVQLSGITDPLLIAAMASGWVDNPTQATATGSAITSLGITDAYTANIVMSSGLTDPTIIQQELAAVTSAGVTSDNIAAAVMSAQITDISLIKAISVGLDAIGYLNTKPFSFAYSGITDPVTMTNFINSMAAAGLANNPAAIDAMAVIIKTGGLITSADMSAAIATYMGVTPTLGTPSSTTTIVTTFGTVTTPLNLNLVPSSCTGATCTAAPF